MELRTSNSNQRHREIVCAPVIAHNVNSDHHAAMPRLRPASPSRRRGPKPDRRRALELLASSRNGCTEAIMLAHGFTVEQMVDLCFDGLAIGTPERMVVGGRTVEVVRMKITESGRRALT
jgi:hypothetical protein